MAKSSGFGGFNGVVGWRWEGRNVFGSVGVCDEACRLNGSRYESNIGSLCGWLTILLPNKAWEKLDQMVVRVQGAPDKFFFWFILFYRYLYSSDGPGLSLALASVFVSLSLRTGRHGRITMLVYIWGVCFFALIFIHSRFERGINWT